MLTVVLWTSTLFALTGARVYDRCELAYDLLRLGLPRDHISTWVCIAFHESRLNTAAWNRHSGDHGILQISELYWCGPGKACGVTCSSLRDSDITNDVQCALKIYREHTRLQGDGFMAWVVYPQYCRGNKNYVKDCNRLSKNYSEKLYNISQSLPQSDVLNFTVPQFVEASNVNRPLPTYLAINTLIQKTNFEKFERDYYNNNNKRLFDWQSYKIDNIDELKLPVINREGRVESAIPATATTYTTTTTPRSTTTLEPALIGIKPPSPRRIESNQFRRRKMKLEKEPHKTENDSLVTKATVVPTSSSITLTTPRTIKVSALQTICNYQLSPLTETSTSVPTSTKTTTTTATSTITPQMTLKELSAQTLMTDFLFLTTTVKPTTGTTLRAMSQIQTENPNYNRTQKLSTAKPDTTGAVTSRERNRAFRGFRFYSSPFVTTATPRSVTTPYVPEETQVRVLEVTTREPEYISSLSSNDRLTNTNFKISRPKQGISLNHGNTNKSSEIHLSEINSITPSIINVSEMAKEYVSIVNTTKSSSVYEITHMFNKTLTSTTVSEKNIRQPYTIKTQPSSRGISRYTHPTTQTPILSLPGASTAAPRASRLDSKPSAASTTHSIFDLYLNPTTRPILKPFSFAPFDKNPIRLRIFSGGTTPLPIVEKEESKTLSIKNLK